MPATRHLTVYRTYIFLGRDEWGNELMAKVAAAYANEHADKRPLLCETHEHAGWFLSFTFGAPGLADGTIAETANDTAVLPQAVLDFGKSIENEIFLESVRRP